MELFECIKAEIDMPFSTFALSLDLLYLIDAANVNAGGVVELCSG
jgi:hypothetical protein